MEQKKLLKSVTSSSYSTSASISTRSFFSHILLLFWCFQAADELYSACRFVAMFSSTAHKIVPRPRFVRVLDCAQILAVRTLNCARFFVVPILPEFILHSALFPTPTGMLDISRNRSDDGAAPHLFVSEDEKDRISQLVLRQHPHQFLPRLAHSLAIVAVHYEDEACEEQQQQVPVIMDTSNFLHITSEIARCVRLLCFIYSLLYYLICSYKIPNVFVFTFQPICTIIVIFITIGIYSYIHCIIYTTTHVQCFVYSFSSIF